MGRRRARDTDFRPNDCLETEELMFPPKDNPFATEEAHERAMDLPLLSKSVGAFLFAGVLRAEE